MNRLKQLPALLKRAGTLAKAQPFAVLALLGGIVAAVLTALLPWQLAPIINDISLAVGRRIAGTGITKPAPIRAETLALTIRAAVAMALYLFAVWAALHSARKARVSLRRIVQEKRLQYEAEGHTPPPDWEKDVGRDIDHICASIAAAPEWLMLIAGAICCIVLLTKLPPLPALLPPVTALLCCYVRDALRLRKRSRSMLTAAVAAIWAAAVLGALALLTLRADPAVPLGSIVLELLSMTVLIPAALQLPYRNIRPTREALNRIRGFLK